MIDVGFIEAPSHLQNIVTDVCCKHELDAVCSPAHPIARLKTATPEQLAQYPFISRESGFGTREAVDRCFRNAGSAPETLDVVMKLGSPEALQGLAATGVGFTIMSQAAVTKETRLGLLVRIPLAPQLARDFSVAYQKEKFRSRLFNTFVQFAKSRPVAVQPV